MGITINSWFLHAARIPTCCVCASDLVLTTAQYSDCCRCYCTVVVLLCVSLHPQQVSSVNRQSTPPKPKHTLPPSIATNHENVKSKKSETGTQERMAALDLHFQTSIVACCMLSVVLYRAIALQQKIFIRMSASQQKGDHNNCSSQPLVVANVNSSMLTLSLDCVSMNHDGLRRRSWQQH